MKKIVYLLVILVSSAFVFTACTEEEIAPSTENGGGTAQVEIRK